METFPFFLAALLLYYELQMLFLFFVRNDVVELAGVDVVAVYEGFVLVRFRAVGVLHC